MNNDSHLIINVGRQLGSGGHDIGQMLAADFGAKFYDREILNLAARESGFSEEVFEKSDERRGFLRSLLGGMPAPHVGGDGFYPNSFSQEGLFKMQSDAIRHEAQLGACVFVGRCADYVLRDFPHTFSVFITAPMQNRIDNIARKENVTPAEARHIIEQGEKRRAEYYNYYTGKKWGTAQNYDLCVDASLIGTERTAQFIARFIRCRFGMSDR